MDDGGLLLLLTIPWMLTQQKKALVPLGGQWMDLAAPLLCLAKVW